MSDVIDTVRKEWATISGAPWSSLVLSSILVAATWGFFELIHNAEISGKDATIEAQKAQIDSYKEKLSGASPEEAKAKIADLEALTCH